MAPILCPPVREQRLGLASLINETVRMQPGSSAIKALICQTCLGVCKQIQPVRVPHGGFVFDPSSQVRQSKPPCCGLPTMRADVWTLTWRL